MKPDKFKSFFIGKNNLFFPEEEFVIKLSYPRVFVRFKVTEGYYSDFDIFFNNVADVQYLDGKHPSDSEHNKIITDVWNFITMEKSSSADDYVNGNAD